MGDQRFQQHYDRVRSALDRSGEIAQMGDDAIIQALGAASRDRDPYLANVLTTAALNRSRRARSIIENIGEGVCILNRDGLISSANPAAVRILGWPSTDLVGGYFHALVHANLGRHHEQGDDCPLGNALSSLSARGSHDDQFARADGTVFDVYVSVSPILVDDTVEGLIVLFADVHERKRAERLLQQQAIVLEGAVETTLRELAERRREQAAFQAILDASPDALIVTNARGIVTYANDGVRRLFGYEPDDIVGERGDLLVPERLRSASPIVADETDVEARVTLVGLRKDGTEFPIEMIGARTRDASRASTLTTIRDLSVRRVAEEKAMEQVEGRVAARTAALERSYRELEAFSYSVSHDLQAPLRALDFLADALVEDHKTLPRSVVADLDRMKAETARMRGFVKAMLDLSRIGVGELSRADVDLTALARTVSERLREGEPTRRVELMVEPGMRTEADAVLLEGLLANLLSNAWKYSARRPVAHVVVGRTPEDPNVFFVRDDGEGFDMRLAGRLFQPFSRLHKDTDYAGTGVGLAGAKRVVDKHGGRIWAQGVPGQGATFYFTLAPEA